MRSSSTTPPSARRRPPSTRAGKSGSPSRTRRFGSPSGRSPANSKRRSTAMRVAALRLFLTSLRPALEAAGDPGPGRSTISAAAAALAPFDDIALDEFAAFLIRADEFRKTGAVRVPRAADRSGEKLQEATAQLAAVRAELGRPDALADLEAGRTA